MAPAKNVKPWLVHVAKSRPTMTNVETAAVGDNADRPKSKKELRAEKKAARKRAEAAAASADPPVSQSKEDAAAEKHRLRKERRKLQLQEREKALRKQERLEKKMRKQKRKRRELHAVGGGLDPQQAQERLEEHRRNKKQKKANSSEKSKGSEDQDKAVFDQVFNGVGEEGGDNAGFRTLEMGLKLRDMAVGKGEVARRGCLLTVQYKLTGGCFGPQGKLIDSSKKFNFRLGKGEVVRGWDLGCAGMAVGGRRRLIVPPKCGYGGEDIGAGPGALLYFDITLLACR